MLNYSAMKNHLKLIYIAPVLLALLMTACSSPDDANNHNAEPTANTNTSPPVTQTAPPTTPSLVPPPVPLPPTPAPPAVKSNAPNANTAAANPPAAQAANKPAAGKTGAPKLAVLTKDKGLDFGKQPQEKSLVRAIQIKNTGTAELKIETVAPG
jgi:hypothetical protein